MPNQIPTDGIIHITLPKWNPSSPAPQSVFNVADATCVDVTNVAGVTCTTIRNLNGNVNQDKLQVQGNFNIPVGGNTVEFEISNYLNPPSFEPFTFVSVYTTTSDVSNILDQNEAVILEMNTTATLPAANVNISAANSETNQVTTYTFSIQVSNPLPLNSRIEITFPSEINLTTSTPAGIGSGKLASRFDTFYDSGTRVLQLSDIIDNTANYVYSDEIITFEIDSITNPPTTAPTSTFTILTFAGVGYDIETNTDPITFTATGGNILNFTIVPELYAISHRVQYTFTFVTENTITAGSTLLITYPAEIRPPEEGTPASPLNCLTDISGDTNGAAICTNPTTDSLLISGAFTSEIANGTTFSFLLAGNQNPPTTETSGGFLAEFGDGSGNVIDLYTATDTIVNVTATTDTFNDFIVTPASLVTGVETSYTIEMNTAYGILENSTFSIIIPSDIVITSITATQNSCTANSGIDAAFTCALVLNADSTHTLTITNAFPITTVSGQALSITLSNLRNPRSLTPTLSFKAYINDQNGFGQYATESGITVTMTTPSDFTDITLSRASTINAVVTSYTFSVTLNNQIQSGDYIQIIFPTEILVQSTPSQCTGITNLQSTLVCSVNGQTVDLQVQLPSGVTTLPATIGTTSTVISFRVNNVRNPYLLSTTVNGFVFNSFTSTKKYLIDRRNPAMTVTNTAAGSISSATVAPVNSDLGATTDYLISFVPDNDILRDTVVRVTIPSELEVNTTLPFG